MALKILRNTTFVISFITLFPTPALSASKMYAKKPAAPISLLTQKQPNYITVHPYSWQIHQEFQL